MSFVFNAILITQNDENHIHNIHKKHVVSLPIFLENDQIL